jgi:Membrane-associated sensor, integral membrane domain
MPTQLPAPSRATSPRRHAARAAARPENPVVGTLSAVQAGLGQRRSAAFFCATFAVATAFLLPLAAQAMPLVPGFIAISQTALVIVYGFTTSLFLAQYRSTHSNSVLILAAGSLFTTLMVLAQLVCFPNMFAPGLVAGQGPATLLWLWNFWHLGPPLFALLYAIMEGDGGFRTTPPRFVSLVAWSMTATVCVLGALLALTAIRFVAYLPIVVEANDGYWSLTTSGIGPVIGGLTALALAVLCWTTRLRSILQLWMAVSLFLLLLDNVITDVGGARGTVGWFAGRGEALVAALVVLGVYLREISRLWELSVTNQGRRAESGNRA